MPLNKAVGCYKNTLFRNLKCSVSSYTMSFCN